MPRNERLLHHRTQRNWRQQDVADELGVSLATVQRWERGIQDPSAYYRAKLCTLFGVSAQELGLLDAVPAAELKSADPVPTTFRTAEEPVLWTIPLARNLHFTGRDDLLAQLEHQFAPQQAGIRQVALTQARAIKGLGGVGKTQIAVEYAYRSEEQGRYTHTLWINAASEEALLASFVALAQDLPTLASREDTDQRALVAAVIHWLEQCPQPWLLIFDNADDLTFLPAYLPARGNGHILFTTRASAVSAIAPSVDVEWMELAEATQLLLRRAQRTAQATEEEIAIATTIAQALAQFPLALDQAGAYIEETGCSLHDYLQLYHQHQYALLAQRGTQATQYPDSVATTWSLSFAQIERTNQAAAELLQLCAFLAPDQIPEELLRLGTAQWPPALQAAVADPWTFNQLVEVLLSFSLVKRLSEHRTLRLHRLVQVVQRERLSHEAQRAWAERVVQAVEMIFPREPREVASWPQCGRYVEQAQACETLIEQYGFGQREAVALLERTGIYYQERGLYRLAEPLLVHAVAIQEQQGAADDLRTADLLHQLARLLSFQGKNKEALSSAQRALALREQQLGPDHLDVASALTWVANIVLDLGDFAQAKRLYLRAWQIREQQVGPDHLLVANVLYNLGRLSLLQRQYAQAEVVLLRVVQIREQQLKPSHSDIMWALAALANAYLFQGKYAEAEPLHKRVLRTQEQQLGPDHPLLAVPLYGLAELYARQGQDDKAEPLYRRALFNVEQQGGEDNPDIGDILQGLAALYARQSKFDQAELFFQRARHLYEVHQVAEHPDDADVLLGLANLYRDQCKYAEAEPLYQRSRHIRERQLGLEHPETADLLSDLAQFHEMQGQNEEAVRLYQRALTIREHALGPEHPATCATCERLEALLEPLSHLLEAAPPDGAPHADTRA